MKKGLIVWHAFMVFALFFACNVVLNPAGEVSNLVKNGSFETNGQPSLKYWMGKDSFSVQFSDNTPKNGGQWSVVLPSHCFEPLNLRLAQFVNLHSGKHILKLSFWAKGSNLPGRCALIRETSDKQLVLEKEIGIQDTNWVQYALLDTIQLNKGEKIYVNLSGGSSEVAGGYTLYDLVSLTEAGNGD